MAERVIFSKYPLVPNKYKFEKVVRIYCIVFKFIRMCTKRTGSKMQPVKNKFQMFMSFGCEHPEKTFSGKYICPINQVDMSHAFKYPYQTATKEVEEFNKPELIKKIAIEKDGILFNKSRISDGQRLHVAAGCEDLEFLKSFKPFQLGFNLLNPIIDRFSPLADSIAEYVHRKLATHKGYESCYRCSLDYVYIIMGMTLFREMGENCVECKKLRRKYIDVHMGDLPDQAFTIAPCFYISQIDLYGPLHVYVPGHSMLLRNRKQSHKSSSN